MINRKIGWTEYIVFGMIQADVDYEVDYELDYEV